MKSLLILILSVVSCGGAYLSRPSEQSFRELVQRKMESGDKDSLAQVIFGAGKVERFLAECKYQDRILFATVERDGKKIYTGAFNTWFANEQIRQLQLEKAN